MRALRIVAGLIAVVASLSGTHSNATEGEAGLYLHPTTPYEYWKDPCGYPAVIPSEYRIAGGALYRLLQAEAILVPPSQIQQRTDDPNFYRLLNTALNTAIDPETGITIGGDVPFLGETRLASAGRSGYLIGPDIIATAPHTNNFNPAAFVAIFDARAMPDPNGSGSCIPFDPDYIPASNVFYSRPLAPLIANTILYYDGVYGAWTGVDYGAYYLDRPTGRQYLRIRESGEISPRDNLASVGHPVQLPTKLVYGVGYLGDETNLSYPDFTFPTFSNFYLREGMSGGPLYNLDRNYVEISVGSVAGSGCLLYVGDIAGTYQDMYDICDDQPEPVQYSHAEPSRMFNQGPISTLAALVPTTYLRVEPLNDVTFTLPIGGTATPSETTYTATASSHATGPTAVSASVAPPLTPAFVQIGSFDSTLDPGESTTLTATANVPPGTSCGIYDQFVTIVDQTNNFRDKMRYHFEVGMKGFEVAPSDISHIYGVASPSVPAELTFTVSNPYPTPVTFEVTVDEAWAYVATPSLYSPPRFSLGAAGSATDTKSVVVKLNASAFLLLDGTHQFNVMFEAMGDCVRDAPIHRSVVFHKGEIVMDETLEVFISLPTPSPVISSFEVPEAFCVSNASVKLETGYVGTIIGTALQDWAPHLTLSLERTGSGIPRTITLWDGQPIPVGWKVPTNYDEVLGLTEEVLLLDSSEHSPPTGQTFAQVFGNRQAQGTWTLRVEDDGLLPFTRNEPLLLSWQLTLSGHTGMCRL